MMELGGGLFGALLQAREALQDDSLVAQLVEEGATVGPNGENLAGNDESKMEDGAASGMPGMGMPGMHTNMGGVAAGSAADADAANFLSRGLQGMVGGAGMQGMGMFQKQ